MQDLNNKEIPVIDIFAGPGGLSEGFSQLSNFSDSKIVFKVKLSIEKDLIASKTLKLRSFFRSFSREDVPECYYDFIRVRFITSLTSSPSTLAPVLLSDFVIAGLVVSSGISVWPTSVRRHRSARLVCTCSIGVTFILPYLVPVPSSARGLEFACSCWRNDAV